MPQALRDTLRVPHWALARLPPPVPGAGPGLPAAAAGSADQGWDVGWGLGSVRAAAEEEEEGGPGPQGGISMAQGALPPAASLGRRGRERALLRQRAADYRDVAGPDARGRARGAAAEQQAGQAQVQGQPTYVPSRAAAQGVQLRWDERSRTSTSILSRMHEVGRGEGCV